MNKTEYLAERQENDRRYEELFICYQNLSAERRIKKDNNSKTLRFTDEAIGKTLRQLFRLQERGERLADMKLDCLRGDNQNDKEEKQ